MSIVAIGGGSHYIVKINKYLQLVTGEKKNLENIKVIK